MEYISLSRFDVPELAVPNRSRSCGFDHDVHYRWLLLTMKLLNKWFVVVKLPVNSSEAVNSIENYGPVNSLSVKNVKHCSHF